MPIDEATTAVESVKFPGYISTENWTPHEHTEAHIIHTYRCNLLIKVMKSKHVDKR